MGISKVQSLMGTKMNPEEDIQNNADQQNSEQISKRIELSNTDDIVKRDERPSKIKDVPGTKNDGINSPRESSGHAGNEITLNEDVHNSSSDKTKVVISEEESNEDDQLFVSDPVDEELVSKLCSKSDEKAVIHRMYSQIQRPFFISNNLYWNTCQTGIYRADAENIIWSTSHRVRMHACKPSFALNAEPFPNQKMHP